MTRKLMLLFALFLPCVAHADRIIVKMAESSGYSAAIASVSATAVDTLSLVDAEVWEVADDSTAIAELLENEDVEYAEPDLYATLCGIPNDTCFGPQWWAHNPGGLTDCDDEEDVDAPEAWDIYTGDSTMVIAVLDTGMDTTNADLRVQRWVNVDEIPGNNWDDDGNGYRDDRYGWDFGGTGAGDPYMTDTFGHGTAVSGILASRGNNGSSFAGGVWRAQLMTVKVANAQGLQTSLIIKGLAYAKDNGAKIVQNSWVLYAHSNSLSAALTAVNNAGILMVTPAGNDGFDMDVCGATTCYQLPASLHLSNSIIVGATNCDAAIASFSNVGASYVHLFAPGMWIVHPDPGVYCTGSGTHGTSFSSPIVAACAALVWGHEPNLTVAQVKTRILSTSDWRQEYYGQAESGGRVNYCRALGGCTGGGNGCEDPPCEIENESRGGGENMGAISIALEEARERTDLYDVTGRKVKATRRGVYFQRVVGKAGVTRRTVVVR